ncbi:MAG TPA: type VI secretion system membrane subunit TssM, partial [Polyangiaceae bacterium]|nr:type VI secretion system membrane subunit TssM [Polyangiaceae bacterium]
MSILVAIAVVVFLGAAWTISVAFGLSLWIPTLITSAVVFVIALRLALKEYRGARASREIERSLANQAQQFEKRARPDQQADARALALQFEKALQTLKASKLGRGRGGALYALPWYVIIGPPGAGKSTAIRQSGLKFPLLGSKGSVRGIGGTRNCDWWLTNEAVLLDTAGRYATEEDDRDEWLAFLAMLRRARPKRPLNGLIVALSILDLATAGERDLEQLSGRIRDRVDEVMARLEVRLPVYVVLTKCDLLAGFVESFEDLRKAERAQILGFTLPLRDPRELSDQVEELWTRLVQVIERRSLIRVAEARGAAARQAAFGFPQQLEALKANLASFMSLTFVENVYREAPIVRGVYLTSGTQEGSPVDRLRSSMAEAFGLLPAPIEEAARSDSKSYFLSDLFRTVMFPDQDLAAKSTTAERRLRAARFGVALSLVLTAIMLSTVSVRAYVLNRDIMRGAQGELASAMAARDPSASKPASLAALEPIRARLGTLRTWSAGQAPWRYRGGLYQGDALLPHLRSFYATTLRAVLMEPLVFRLERGLADMVQLKAGLQQAPTSQDHAWLYEQTRAYLLLTQPKEAGEPPLDTELKRWLTSKLVETWVDRDATQVSPADRQAMSEHIAVYLDLLATDPLLGFSRSKGTVAGARELLSRVPMVKLTVDRLVAEIEPLGLDVTFDHLVGASGLPISASGRVRGAFTRRAWQEQLEPLFKELPTELMGDGWVLESLSHDGRTREARTCALRSEYFSRYIDEWRAFVGTIR